MSVQATFSDPLERSREVLERCAAFHDPDNVILAVSGGTDSVVMADVFARLGPEYEIAPDAVAHIRTGTGIPQSRLAARTVAEIHDLEFVTEGYRNEQDSLAARVLSKGWPGSYQGSPATGGHGLEWANRKHKPMEEVYMRFDGQQVWGSGARKLESKKRQGNVPDSGVERDKPRRVWVSPIGGWTSQEKREYLTARGLPVSSAYISLGFSGECTACSFDGSGLLTDIDLLCPELGYAIRTLAVWLYQRARRGDVDLAPKRLCWGWDPDGKRHREETNTTQAMVGCDEESCATRDRPEWLLELPDEQFITREDVEAYWDGAGTPTRFPINASAVV